MKILCYTDNHFCETGSILRHYGTKYSIRLENQISSINWVEQEAINNNCEAVICLGDFFDRPDLNEQEITALNEINWNDLPHYFIVGNHESSSSDLQFSSAKILEAENRIIVSKPSQLNFGSCEICFLPYVVESDRQPIASYFTAYNPLKPRVILSHNDLKGIQMGPVISKSGFEIEDIKANCNLFINGHLHNGKKVAENVYNLGNLTGKDFGEDATKYRHNIFILDTETLTFKVIENPYAFNFYKLEILDNSDIKQLYTLKNNAVLSIKCAENLIGSVKDVIEKLVAERKVIEYRLIVIRDTAEDGETPNISDLTVDHLARFVECCKATLNNTKVLEEELSEICK